MAEERALPPVAGLPKFVKMRESREGDPKKAPNSALAVDFRDFIQELGPGADSEFLKWHQSIRALVFHYYWQEVTGEADYSPRQVRSFIADFIRRGQQLGKFTPPGWPFGTQTRPKVLDPKVMLNEEEYSRYKAVAPLTLKQLRGPVERKRELAKEEAAAEQAEDLVQDLKSRNLFEYVGLEWSPAPEDVARAAIHEIGRSLLGRRVKDEEMPKALRRYRALERKLAMSLIDEKKKAQAIQFLDSTEAIVNQLAEQLMNTDPEIVALREQALEDPNAGVAAQERAIDKAREIVESHPQIAELRKTVPSGGEPRQVPSPFTEEQFQLGVQKEVAAAAPKEAAGVQLRDAFEGFLKAVQGRVSTSPFEP